MSSICWTQNCFQVCNPPSAKLHLCMRALVFITCWSGNTPLRVGARSRCQRISHILSHMASHHIPPGCRHGCQADTLATTANTCRRSGSSRLQSHRVSLFSSGCHESCQAVIKDARLSPRLPGCHHGCCAPVRDRDHPGRSHVAYRHIPPAPRQRVSQLQRGRVATSRGVCRWGRQPASVSYLPRTPAPDPVRQVSDRSRTLVGHMTDTKFRVCRWGRQPVSSSYPPHTPAPNAARYQSDIEHFSYI